MIKSNKYNRAMFTKTGKECPEAGDQCRWSCVLKQKQLFFEPAGVFQEADKNIQQQQQTRYDSQQKVTAVCIVAA